MITREHITGAIRVLNATGTKGRKDALAKMLAADGYADIDVQKILTDLDSYPDWAAHHELDA